MTAGVPIKPTVGRIVWYRPHTYEMTQRHTQPLAAIVCHVWSDTCVNLHVFGDNGTHLPSKTSVTLAQGRPAQPGECEWTPYQQGQARAQQAEQAMVEAVRTGAGAIIGGKVLSAFDMAKTDDEALEIMVQRSRLVGAAGSEDATEALIQAKGLSAPRVMPRDLDDAIVAEHYFTAAQGVGGANVCADDDDQRHNLSTSSPLHLLTFCVLVLRNGFTVTGESACASPENFDAEVGRRVARENARNKLWPLLGYALKDRLYHAGGVIKAGCTD